MKKAATRRRKSFTEKHDKPLTIWFTEGELKLLRDSLLKLSPTGGGLSGWARLLMIMAARQVMAANKGKKRWVNPPSWD